MQRARSYIEYGYIRFNLYSFHVVYIEFFWEPGWSYEFRLILQIVFVGLAGAFELSDPTVFQARLLSFIAEGYSIKQNLNQDG